jgi:hypothetical protein
MITANILQRVFFVKYENYTGTAFTYERNNIQYLISTLHTFPFLTNKQEINFYISRNSSWMDLKGQCFIHPSSDVDIVVIKLPYDISPRHPVGYSTEGMYLSDDAYFMGYPYGSYMTGVNHLNNGFPLPFVKKATISTLEIKKGLSEIIYLDGINNPGFSGGPCVFRKGNTNDISVIGVVKGYIPNEIEINHPLGSYKYNENSGIIEVHSIKNLDGIYLE